MSETDHFAVRFSVWVPGRPAPQGSKRRGVAGQMREQSVYLPAWRTAVKKAVYERYRMLDIRPEDLPMLRGAVTARITFALSTDRRVDSAPDLDKLLRSTWDALTSARVWEDDGRVVAIHADKVHIAPEMPDTGAYIEIRKAIEMNETETARILGDLL